jgi:dTDP-4-dehydrorhamnose reductase
MKILLFGKDGQIGWELQRALSPLGEVIAPDSKQANFENAKTLRDALEQAQPDVIVNAAAYTAVDKAQSDAGRAREINAHAVRVLAEEAKRRDAWLVHYSTDYVFDGKKRDPYVEDDETGPLSTYGLTKLEGEEAIRDCHSRHLIFRTSWVYGAHGSNFAKTILRLAKDREELEVVADQYGAPTSAELIADVTSLVLYRVAILGTSPTLAGTYHLVADGETTWCDYARHIVSLALAAGAPLKVTPDRIYPLATESYPVAAERPKNSRLNTGKLRGAFNLHLSDWRHDVGRLVKDLTTQRAL